MAERDHILTNYRRLLTLTTTMLELISSEQWPAISAIQRDYDDLCSQLMLTTAPDGFDERHKALRDCIAQIIANQEQLRLAMQRRQQQLSGLIHHLVTRRNQIEDYYKVAEL